MASFIIICLGTQSPSGSRKKKNHAGRYLSLYLVKAEPEVVFFLKCCYDLPFSYKKTSQVMHLARQLVVLSENI